MILSINEYIISKASMPRPTHCSSGLKPCTNAENQDKTLNIGSIKKMTIIAFNISPPIINIQNFWRRFYENQ